MAIFTMFLEKSQCVSLSNVDRAQIANNAGAQAFIRIHANGSTDISVYTEMEPFNVKCDGCIPCFGTALELHHSFSEKLL